MIYDSIAQLKEKRFWRIEVKLIFLVGGLKILKSLQITYKSICSLLPFVFFVSHKKTYGFSGSENYVCKSAKKCYEIQGNCLPQINERLDCKRKFLFRRMNERSKFQS